MNGEYIVSTDKKEKIKLDSEIVLAQWLSPVARGGSDAKIEVRTVFVAEGSTIEIKGKSSKGIAPCTIKGKIYNNKFVGLLPIPEKIKVGAEIRFEAKLPKHGLKQESDLAILGAPPIYSTKFAWSAKEVRRGDIVKLDAEFEGVIDNSEVIVVIYEYDLQGHYDKVTSFKTTLEGNAMHCNWTFDYKTCTSQIPTHHEMQKYGKSYEAPRYFFLVVVDGVRIGEKQESGFLVFKEKLYLQLFDAYGVPMKQENFKIRFADGTLKNYNTDEKGFITDDSIPAGKCFVEHVKKQ